MTFPTTLTICLEAIQGWCWVVSLSFATTPMASLEPYELFVHVLGDLPPPMRTFSITATTIDSVGKLKELIYAKTQNRFKDINAKDLVLWKVNPLCSSRRIMN
jgi:Crinkler effector protein N-terminal domain